jgi:hypothetical protein
VKPPPDFHTITDPLWKRTLRRARATRNEVRAQIRERLARLSTPMSNSTPPESRDFIGTIDGGDMRAGWLMICVNVSPEGYRMGQEVRVILPVVESATNQPELPL